MTVERIQLTRANTIGRPQNLTSPVNTSTDIDAMASPKEIVLLVDRTGSFKYNDDDTCSVVIRLPLAIAALHDGRFCAGAIVVQYLGVSLDVVGMVYDISKVTTVGMTTYRMMTRKIEPVGTDASNEAYELSRTYRRIFFFRKDAELPKQFESCTSASSVKALACPGVKPNRALDCKPSPAPPAVPVRQTGRPMSTTAVVCVLVVWSILMLTLMEYKREITQACTQTAPAYAAALVFMTAKAVMRTFNWSVCVIVTVVQTAVTTCVAA